MQQSTDLRLGLKSSWPACLQEISSNCVYQSAETISSAQYRSFPWFQACPRQRGLVRRLLKTTAVVLFAKAGARDLSTTTCHPMGCRGPLPTAKWALPQSWWPNKRCGTRRSRVATHQTGWLGEAGPAPSKRFVVPIVWASRCARASVKHQTLEAHADGVHSARQNLQRNHASA